MTLLTAVMLAAAVPDHSSFLEEALFAGGAHDEAELTRLVALYHRRIDPIVAVVKDQPQQIAAQLLLKHLHVSYGGTEAVLKEYKSAHWSVNEALETGTYNCLSASMLYALAARQAGLEVDGEVYSDHARVLLHIDGHEYQVEATSEYGYGASDWFIRTRVDARTLALRFEIETPERRGLETLLEGAWAWAGERRDSRWASRVAVPPPPPLASLTPPPLVPAAP
jgi:hypothetical protein